MMYPFIEKLLRMLDDQDTQHIASWSDDGKSIIIHDLRNFEAQVLSKHFPYGRSDSFCRQLNIYNFKRTSDARKQRQNPKSRVSTFEHPHFQRGRLDLIGLIRRNKPIRASRSKHQNDKDHSPFQATRSPDYSVRLPSIHNLPNWNTYQPGSLVSGPTWSLGSDTSHSQDRNNSDTLLGYFRSNQSSDRTQSYVIRHSTYNSLPRTQPHDELYSDLSSSRISRDPHPSSVTNYSDTPSRASPSPADPTSPTTPSTQNQNQDAASIFSIENLIN